MAIRLTFSVLILVAINAVSIGQVAAKEDPIAAAFIALLSESATSGAELKQMKTEVEKTEEKLNTETKRIAREEKNIPKEATEFDIEQKASNDFYANMLAQGCRPDQRTKDLDLAARCNLMIDEYNRRQRALNVRFLKLKERLEKFPGDREQLKEDTLKWFADKKRLQTVMAGVETRIAAIQSRIAICPGLSTNPSVEEIKHECGNRQFDGAQVNLPPCDTPACKRYDCAVFRRCQ